MPTALIVGCGDVGIRLGMRLVASGHEVWGLRRDVSRLLSPIKGLAADLRDLNSLRFPRDFDYVFYLPSADARTDDAYRGVYVDGVRHLYRALSRGGVSPNRVFYVSSTGVYGQNDGRWVDENSPARPASGTGRRLLEGESVANSGGYPCTVVRFAGIYGPGRNWLVERVRAGTTCVATPPLYTNRIHSDDCARVLHHVMNLPQPETLYIGVDKEPSPQCLVMNWIAKRLGVAPPRPVSGGAADVGSNIRANKRCSNRRLTGSGFRYHYPTFREGYAELLPD